MEGKEGYQQPPAAQDPKTDELLTRAEAQPDSFFEERDTTSLKVEMATYRAHLLERIGMSPEDFAALEPEQQRETLRKAQAQE